jgi:hypothetical protein
MGGGMDTNIYYCLPEAGGLIRSQGNYCLPPAGGCIRSQGNYCLPPAGGRIRSQGNYCLPPAGVLHSQNKVIKCTVVAIMNELRNGRRDCKRYVQ